MTILSSAFRTLGFFGFLRAIFEYPFFVATYRKCEKKHRKIAESMGLTFEEYRERLIIYYDYDGKPLTDKSAIEAIRKEYAAEVRACGLEELKQKYGYKDF